MKKWIQKITSRKKKPTTKKTKNKMANLNEAGIQRLISLKESFSGQKFQWVKTADDALLGKVVECRDIQPTQRGRFMAYFDDGSKVDAEHINDKLMMLHGDMRPLSKGDIKAINGPSTPNRNTEVPPGVVVDPKDVGTSATNESKLHSIPNEFDEFRTHPEQNIPKTEAAPNVEQKPSAPTGDMFAMFNADETNLSINIKIKMPDKKLLKMMYTSAEDKDKFINQLSGYVYSQINKDITKDSLIKILDPPKKAPRKKTDESEIKVTEIDNENN